MIDEQSSASGHDYASDRSAIGAGSNKGLFQFCVMPFSLCNAPATFERLMDRVLYGVRWSRCLVYLDYVISFGTSIPETLARLEEVLSRLSDVGLQLTEG